MCVCQAGILGTITADGWLLTIATLDELDMTLLYLSGVSVVKDKGVDGERLVGGFFLTLLMLFWLSMCAARRTRGAEGQCPDYRGSFSQALEHGRAAALTVGGMCFRNHLTQSLETDAPPKW